MVSDALMTIAAASRAVSEIPENNKNALRMNFYVSLMLEAEGAKERLRRLFQSPPEVKKNGLPQSARNLLGAV